MVVLDQIENICFEGGGIRGMAFVGVYQALEELNLSTQIKRFIGSSAGAIFAAGGACRIPCATMRRIMETTDFRKFKDARWGILTQGYNLIRHWGMYSGDYFLSWMRNILDLAIDAPDITFAQVNARFGTDLVITATNLTIGEVVYLTKNSTPNMRVCDAIRRSMSIPVMYTPIVECINRVEHVYIDGGCMNNFPLSYFDILHPPERTIGFNLQEEGETDPTELPETYNHINSLVDVITMLINSNLAKIQDLQLTEDDRARIISIPTFGIRSTNFDLQLGDLHRLIESGYHSTLLFLKK